METLKQLKIFTNIFSNKGEYLFYDGSTDIWYFVSDVTKEGLSNNNTGNIVLSKVKFKNNFKELFFNKFNNLFEIINKHPNNYFISLRKINSFINKSITSKKDELIDPNEVLEFVQLDIKEFIKSIERKIDTDGFIGVDLKKSNIDQSGVIFIDVNKVVNIKEVIKTKNIFVPFKNGYCVSSGYMKRFDNDKLYLKLYTSNCQTYSYSIVYKNEELEVESIQPFHIFVNN